MKHVFNVPDWYPQGTVYDQHSCRTCLTRQGVLFCRVSDVWGPLLSQVPDRGQLTVGVTGALITKPMPVYAQNTLIQKARLVCTYASYSR